MIIINSVLHGLSSSGHHQDYTIVTTITITVTTTVFVLIILLVKYHQMHHYCVHYCHPNHSVHQSLSPSQIGFITTMYFVPLMVIVVLYLMILNRLWYGVVPGGSRSAESVRGKKRVTRMVVIVVVTFIVCWFPVQVSPRDKITGFP